MFIYKTNILYVQDFRKSKGMRHMVEQYYKKTEKVNLLF